MTHEFMTIALWSKQRKGMGCFTGNYSLFMTHDFRTNEHVKTIYLSLLGTPGGALNITQAGSTLSLTVRNTQTKESLFKDLPIFSLNLI